MADYSEQLKKYIEQAKTSFATSLEERIARLAKEEREEQIYGAEKLQQAGKFTSGFRPGLLAKIMDIFAGRKGEVRGEYDERAYQMAMQLLGLSQQAELTREGYALQRYLASLTGGGGGGGGGGGTRITYAPGVPTAAKTVAKSTKTDYDKAKSDYLYKKYATTYPQYRRPVTGKTYDWRTEMAKARTYMGRGGEIY